MEPDYSIEQLQFRLKIGQQCAYFRKHVLRLTLKELSNKSGIPIPTLSSFELGRSSNLKFLYLYLVSCETQEQKNILIKSIVKILERGWSYD